MLRIGEEEVKAVRRVVKSGMPFRYRGGSECARFEERYGKYLGVKHVVQTSSGTVALTAALMALEIGPGDEVIVPAHTFMASAISVLSVGAIPVIVDIDESIGIDPDAIDDAVGPQTRAVMPCHMWGLACDMRRIMRVARKHKLLVVEDACQAVGGGYEGKMLGAIGHVGAFSFNFYKNMTCGEGGAVVTNNGRLLNRLQCAIDCCRFYWTGRDKDFRGFVCTGARPSEFEGAMLNAQLSRLPAMIRTLRKQKKRILKATADVVRSAPVNSLDYECGTTNHFRFDTPGQAERFAQLVGGTVLSKTGRHNYTEWDPILAHRGAHHPALNPFNLPQNRKCRKRYSKTMCKRSLDILARTVAVGNHPDRKAKDVTALIRKIKEAAKGVGA